MERADKKVGVVFIDHFSFKSLTKSPSHLSPYSHWLDLILIWPEAASTDF